MEPTQSKLPLTNISLIEKLRWLLKSHSISTVICDQAIIAISQEKKIAELEREIVAWKDMASKMREISVSRHDKLVPRLTDEEIGWLDEYVELKARIK